MRCNFFGFIIFLVLIWSKDANSESYEYTTLTGHMEGGLWIDTNPATPGIGVIDVVEPVSFCRKSDPYICFTSEVLNFAVPRDIKNKKAWDYAGQHYEVTRYFEKKLLGTLSRAYLIESMQKNVTVKFLYSVKRGLLGIEGASSEGRAPTLISTQKKGFGAR